MSSSASSGSVSPTAGHHNHRHPQHRSDSFAGTSPTFIMPHRDAGSPVIAAAHGAAVPRVNQACANCRRRKVRCDGTPPRCGNCIARGIECTYPVQKKRGRPPKIQNHLVTEHGVDLAGPSSNPSPPARFDHRLGQYPAPRTATPPAQWDARAPAALLGSDAYGAYSAFDPAAVSSPSALFWHQAQPPAYAGHHGLHTFAQPGAPHLASTTASTAAAAADAWLGVSAAQSAGSHPGYAAAPYHMAITSGAPASTVGLHAAVYSAPPGGLQLPRHASGSSADPGFVGGHPGVLSADGGSAATDFHGSDYFEPGVAPVREAPSLAVADTINLQGVGAFFGPGMRGVPGGGGPPQGMYQLGGSSSLGYSTIFSPFMPLTAAPPVPPLLQAQPLTAHTGTPPPPASAAALLASSAVADGVLSTSLDSVAVALVNNSASSESIQTALNRLAQASHSVSPPRDDARAGPVAMEGVEPVQPAEPSARIHASLLRMERHTELAGRAVHNYFCYIHQQCPILHKPTFLVQAAGGSVNRFVWLSMRTLAARTLLQSHTLSEADVLAEEEHFAERAQAALSEELARPGVETIQGLVLLALYLFGTPRWQESSMYWCQAVRLAQLLELHLMDAPPQAIASKMHFGTFEPEKPGTSHHHDLALVPGDFSGNHMPAAQQLAPVEAELRRRLWWVLFTHERFCAITERLPAMVDETRMYVHLPCSAHDWDSPEFAYEPPAHVPLYQRDQRAPAGVAAGGPGLAAEIQRRKGDNLYLLSEIEYGFAMSHLVAFMAEVGSLFRPRTPYSNDYMLIFAQLPPETKMMTLRTNVERIECIFEGVRQDTLRRMAAEPATAAGVARPAPLHAGAIDPVLDPEAEVAGIEIPCLHHLAMLVLYSALNIHLYRLVFQMHYELSASLPPADADARTPDDAKLLDAFDSFVEELWARARTAAQQVSSILRGEHSGVPSEVLALAGIKQSAHRPAPAAAAAAAAAGEHGRDDAKPDSAMDRQRRVFREMVKVKEARLREVAHSVLASFHRTLPYALLLVAKVHADSIKWWSGVSAEETARAMLDASEVVRVLETHQALFSSTDYVALVKGMLQSAVSDDDMTI